MITDDKFQPHITPGLDQQVAALDKQLAGIDEQLKARGIDIPKFEKPTAQATDTERRLQAIRARMAAKK